MRDECEHGQLRRSCEICELRAELNGMNREAEKQSRLIDKQAGEIARLRQRINSAPVVEVTACNQIPGASDFDYGQLSAAFAGFKTGQRVRLVVETDDNG